MHTQVRKKQSKHKKTAVSGGKKGGDDDFEDLLYPLKSILPWCFCVLLWYVSGAFLRQFAADWSSRISPLGVVVGWERVFFSTESFWSKKKSSQTTKNVKEKFQVKGRLASEGDVFGWFVKESSTEILPKCRKPMPYPLPHPLRRSGMASGPRSWIDFVWRLRLPRRSSFKPMLRVDTWSFPSEANRFREGLILGRWHGDVTQKML